MGTTAYTSSDTSNATTTDSYAAKLCDNYTYGGYSDWFLPSIQELKQGWATFNDDSHYCSSSEYSSSNAWVYFSNDDAPICIEVSRNSKLYVRAVRAF